MAWTGQNLPFLNFILGLFNEAALTRGVNMTVNKRTVRQYKLLGTDGGRL
jgi:hypothetical protein